MHDKLSLLAAVIWVVTADYANLQLMALIPSHSALVQFSRSQTQAGCWCVLLSFSSALFIIFNVICVMRVMYVTDLNIYIIV